MDTTTIIVIAAFILFIFIKRMGQISADDAVKLLQSGAVLLDVRTPGEFAGGSVGMAENLPLDEISARAAEVLVDKNRPILVFCLSGTRSAMAKRFLQNSGYTNVHNLGSLLRAKSIVQQHKL